MFDDPAFCSYACTTLALLQGEGTGVIDASFYRHLAAALAFALVGLVFFGVAFFIMVKSTPFSVRKEIEEDQNVALAILIGSVILGLSIIIAAAIS